jgi:hypothetical protein
MSSMIDLPILVGLSDVFEGSPRQRWLDRLRVCRQQLLETSLRQGGPLEPAGSIDQALGLILVHRFVRDRRSAALPIPDVGPSGTTPHGYCRSLRQLTASPVLQAALDVTGFGDSDPLPQDVWRVALTADLAWRDQAGHVVQLPPTVFGEFHQLCLAENDAGEAGEQRARGVHYAPVSLADYLTARVFDRLSASHDTRTRLRILDPSCGGGTFLLAALRRLLQRQDHPSPQQTLDLLEDSLFGIDIDPQAIGGTRWIRQLSLLTEWSNSF